MVVSLIWVQKRGILFPKSERKLVLLTVLKSQSESRYQKPAPADCLKHMFFLIICFFIYVGFNF